MILMRYVNFKFSTWDSCADIFQWLVRPHIQEVGPLDQLLQRLHLNFSRPMTNLLVTHSSWSRGSITTFRNYLENTKITSQVSKENIEYINKNPETVIHSAL